MTTRVVTVDRNETLDVADDIMTERQVRHVPVLDQGRLVGVVSQRDIFHSALSAALGYGEKGISALLRTLRVKEVMNEPPITIAPDAPVRDAVRLMLEKKVGCLPVVDGDRLVGLVTETDVLRHAAGL